MTVLRTIGGPAMLVLALLLGGCASGGMGAAGGEGAVAVQVENDLIPPTSLSVFAVASTGTRRLIGTVQPSATRTLSFDPISVSGEYVLVAETTAGREIRSNPIVISRGDTISWDVSANIAIAR